MVSACANAMSRFAHLVDAVHLSTLPQPADPDAAAIAQSAADDEGDDDLVDPQQAQPAAAAALPKAGPNPKASTAKAALVWRVRRDVWGACDKSI